MYKNEYSILIIVIGWMLRRNYLNISFGNVAPSMKRIWKYNGASSQTRETTPVYIYRWIGISEKTENSPFLDFILTFTETSFV